MWWNDSNYINYTHVRALRVVRWKLGEYLLLCLCVLHADSFPSICSVGPQGAAERVQEAQVEARGGGVCSHADRGRRGRPRFTHRGGAAGRGAAGRGTGPPAAQNAPGDPHADPGGPQQAAGVAAPQAEGASATGTPLWEARGWGVERDEHSYKHVTVL